MTADMLLVDLDVATMDPDREGYGSIRRAVIAIEGGVISYVGSPGDAPAATAVVSLGGRWVTPGLIDCHTHLIFGGNRATEFELRLGGSSYAELAAAGGGIASTVAATRAADDDTLVRDAVRRVGWLARNGATTVEVKSGYGLDLDHELRLLRMIRRVAAQVPVEVVATLLGAHTVPAEFAAERGAYVDLVCAEMIPAAAGQGSVSAVDVFCETVGFSLEESERVLDAARAAGLAVKAHVGQLSDLGGAELAAEKGALSADHLEHVSASGVAALAEAGTVAVLLPGASYVLGETVRPPVGALREAGVPIAVSTDLNPGTSPLGSLPLACSLAANRFGLTPVECLVGVTRNAARALGLWDRGVVRAGMRADLAVWDIDGPEELTYWVGADLCHATMRGGALTTWQGGVQ